MIQSRRHFLLSSAAFAAGFGGLHTLFAKNGFSTPGRHHVVTGYGPLRRDPHRILDLPDGFSFRVLARKGDRMDDGLLTPGRPDGMAAFPGPDGRTLLVCNHENHASTPDQGAYGGELELLSRINQDRLYDFGQGTHPCVGGTSTFVFDTRTGEVERHFLSLAGTERNCAGGPTPWGSWITCEETNQKAEASYEKDHGFCFEVPADPQFVVESPQPIKSMGRFNHEAVAVDPGSGVVYLTEDRHDGLIYRYVPNTPGKLADGGRLEALMIRDFASLDTRNWESEQVAPGRTHQVAWLALENIESPEDDLRHRGFSQGAARFARGEGMWFGKGAVYFACTNGGAAKKGQIWRYFPSPFEGKPDETTSPGRLQLFLEPNDAGLVDNGDNVTVTPWGDLIICEDGPDEQHVVGVTPDGGIYKIARNSAPDNSEFAGATCSPDGTTLFINIQSSGITLAITGPWETRA